MSQVGRSLIEQRALEQKRAVWQQEEKQLLAVVMQIMGKIARLEDELIEAERALEVHRGKKVG